MRRTTAGFLAFVSAFALVAASVNAEPVSIGAEGAAGVGEELSGGECSASQPVDSQLASVVEQLRRAQALEAEGSQSGDIIVLNNRGYNYGPPRGIEIDLIRAEAKGAGH